MKHKGRGGGGVTVSSCQQYFTFTTIHFIVLHFHRIPSFDVLSHRLAVLGSPFCLLWFTILLLSLLFTILFVVVVHHSFCCRCSPFCLLLFTILFVVVVHHSDVVVNHSDVVVIHHSVCCCCSPFCLLLFTILLLSLLLFLCCYYSSLSFLLRHLIIAVLFLFLSSHFSWVTVLSFFLVQFYIVLPSFFIAVVNLLVPVSVVTKVILWLSFHSWLDYLFFLSHSSAGLFSIPNCFFFFEPS